MNFLKKGAAAVKAALEKDDAERALRFQPFRFWLEKGGETSITFLDGELEGGLLSPGVAFQEHMLKKPGGGYENICCTQEQEDCPVCFDGDRPSLVFAFTILDHTQWKDKNGVLHEHQRRLFVCKGDSFKLLQAKAIKPKPMSSDPEPLGLKGVTFNVLRIGEKSPGVGTSFDPAAKVSLEQLAKATGLKPEELAPLKYEEVIKYLTADELRSIGHGKGSMKAVGSADSKALGGEKKEEGSPIGKKTPFNPAAEM